MARGFWATLCLSLAACSNIPGGGGGDGGGGGTGGTGGSNGTRAEYDICIERLRGQCLAGFECISFGILARCVQTCTPPSGACPIDKLCVPQYATPAAGYCARRREHYETCDSVNASACDTDAFCLSQSTAMPARCVPVCDAGTLGNFTTVILCPDLPAELGAMTTTCTPITVGSVAGSLCSNEARVGAPCDQAILHCSLDDARPDTDIVAEPAPATDLDPGALHCLRTADGARCIRVCTVDGLTFSPCACPGTDTLCDDPTDPGMAWACLGWAKLTAPISGCVPVEDCSGNPNVCADNTLSGYTACVPTPYDSGPTSVCAVP